MAINCVSELSKRRNGLKSYRIKSSKLNWSAASKKRPPKLRKRLKLPLLLSRLSKSA